MLLLKSRKVGKAVEVVKVVRLVRLVRLVRPVGTASQLGDLPIWLKVETPF